MAGDIDIRRLPITTTFDPPPGYVVQRQMGTCWGITVRSRSVFGQMVAGLESMVGGEITQYTELANHSRNEAVERMESHAIQMGANCILGMRFDSSDLMENTNEIIAYGTAVVVVPVTQ
jgi:uncharacterized protein YbjQ (UPF0145 family)